jgi:hypothetical protein
MLANALEFGVPRMPCSLWRRVRVVASDGVRRIDCTVRTLTLWASNAAPDSCYMTLVDEGRTREGTGVLLPRLHLTVRETSLKVWRADGGEGGGGGAPRAPGADDPHLSFDAGGEWHCDADLYGGAAGAGLEDPRGGGGGGFGAGLWDGVADGSRGTRLCAYVRLSAAARGEGGGDAAACVDRDILRLLISSVEEEGGRGGAYDAWEVMLRPCVSVWRNQRKRTMKALAVVSEGQLRQEHAWGWDGGERRGGHHAAMGGGGGVWAQGPKGPISP